MKRIIILLLVAALCIPLVSCKEEKKSENKVISNILFLGDDLMETSRVYEYFEQLCHINGKSSVSIDHYTLEDARMYTYADMCESDEDFREHVSKADVILFQEGSAETKTTVESFTKILEYANDPIVVCISYYGYPRWLHRNIFLESHPEFRYADSNTVVGGILTPENAPVGYEHLYHEDYIHPNELNGYIVSLICYSKVYNIKPASIKWQGIEENEGLLINSPCSNTQELKDLLSLLSEQVNKHIN
ncbi:MAG: hypothetical protein IKT46_01815 [Clostridia bacterium]|nr:hypothetical protein [Clostridia bacterium]